MTRAMSVLGSLSFLATLAIAAPALAQQPQSQGSSGSPSPTRLDPHAEFSLQGGAGGWTRGMSNATRVGPMWEARIGVQLFSWLAFDGTYVGSYNAGHDAVVGAGLGVLSNGGYGDVRLIAPLGHVQPYALAGYGASWSSVVRRDPQNTTLTSGGSMIAPVGLGVDFELTRSLSLALEGTYQFSVGGGTLAPSDPSLGQGDTWNVGLAVGYKIP